MVDQIADIVKVLLDGGVILTPTDTIWGLSCSIHSEEACERIYDIKQRPKSKPLLLLVDSIDMLKDYVKNIHPRVETMLSYHVQPVTIIYEPSEFVPGYLIPESGKIGIRVVQDEFCKTYLNLLGHPICSTSANLSSQKFPKTFADIDPVLKEKADYVVKYSQESEKQGVPSIIAKFNKKGVLDFLRS